MNQPGSWIRPPHVISRPARGPPGRHHRGGRHPWCWGN